MFYHRNFPIVLWKSACPAWFGEQNSEAQAHDQLDFALANVVNLINTAEMYPVPPRLETQWLTERYIGSCKKRRGQREKIVLASKVLSLARGNDLEVRPQQMLDRKNIRQAMEDGLQRLNTDYLDLYQVHWLQRSTNCFGKLNYRYTDEKLPVTLLETLEAMNEQGSYRKNLLCRHF